MSEGRWERQSNGDYQHFSDEEIAEREFDKVILAGAACALIGPYLLITNYSDIGEWFYLGCFLTIVGLICIIKAPGETIGTMLGYAIIGGGLWYVGSGRCSSDEKKDSKEKTETVSHVKSTAKTLANTCFVMNSKISESNSNKDVSLYEI